MAEKTLYTALGHFRCRHDKGRRYPVILMDHHEFGMDPQEMTLWTALCWRLTERQCAHIYGDMDINLLRKRVGMVFQKPNPFPMSVYDNIAYGPRTHGIHSKAQLDDIVEKSLRDAAIWDELKDRLKKSALGLSGGQQQRLCIARALAVQPEVLLMDEPTSALDPISTSKIEDLAVELKKDYTIVMVTHNMQQAARISDKTAFFLLGEVIEFGETEQIFSMPKNKKTEDYITGRFG